MGVVVIGIGVLALVIVLVCLWSLFRPQWVFELSDQVLVQPWLMPVAVTVRLALGLGLLTVASDSAFPGVFSLVGWLSIAAALVLPAVGAQRLRRLIEWMHRSPLWITRLWMLFGIVLGIALLLGLRTVSW